MTILYRKSIHKILLKYTGQKQEVLELYKARLKKMFPKMQPIHKDTEFVFFFKTLGTTIISDS